jgi:pilus assembly protein Flp/PilA
MLKTLKSLFKDESGATAVEYALVIGLVSIAIITAAQGLGTSVTNAFDNISGALNDASGN